VNASLQRCCSTDLLCVCLVGPVVKCQMKGNKIDWLVVHLF
jgi:hypothetical protein